MLAQNEVYLSPFQSWLPLISLYFFLIFLLNRILGFPTPSSSVSPFLIFSFLFLQSTLSSSLSRSSKQLVSRFLISSFSINFLFYHLLFLPFPLFLVAIYLFFLSKFYCISYQLIPYFVSSCLSSVFSCHFLLPFPLLPSVFVSYSFSAFHTFFVRISLL